MSDNKPWTKAQLMKCLLSDMAPFGFEKYNGETLRLQTEEVTVYVVIDIARCHRVSGDSKRTVYLNFWADLAELPLTQDPRGVWGLWRSMLDEYLVFNLEGPYEPYTLSAEDSYETSRLRKDVIEFGLPLLMAYTTKQGVFNMLCGASIRLCEKSVVPFYPARRFYYALALYLADKLHLDAIVERALAKIRVYIDGSTKDRLDMRKLVLLDADIADVLKRRDRALYNSVVDSAE